MITVLKELIERHRRLQFDAAMEKMSKDPAIRGECQAIAEDFLSVEENNNSE